MESVDEIKTVLVTGGAGYVGSNLVPKLLKEGYFVRVLDLFIFGEVFEDLKDHSRLKCMRGDIRDQKLLEEALMGCDAVIHLACISNDPSFELNPSLGRSINYEAFLPLVTLSKKHAVRRFIYASSSSVYGIKEEKDVIEDLQLEPLTDYSKYKALCEEILLKESSCDFEVLIIRPATVCGYAPRLRLDLTVNILTNHAYHNRLIRVFGGQQLRPNIHIEDMTDLYLLSLKKSSEEVDGKIFNAGYENFSVGEIAEFVQEAVGSDVQTVCVPTEDQRSYHISSEKIRKEWGFVPKHTIKDAIGSLMKAFEQGKVPDAMEGQRYYNIKTMQELALK